MHAWDPSNDIASLWLPRPRRDQATAPPQLTGPLPSPLEDLVDETEDAFDPPTVDSTAGDSTGEGPVVDSGGEEPWLHPDEEPTGGTEALDELPEDALEELPPG